MSLEPLYSEFENDPDMAQLLREFALGLADSRARLRRSLAEGNWREVQRVGHQLKGAGGGYGYPSLSEAGSQLEAAAAAATSRTPQLDAAVANVETQIARIRFTHDIADADES